MSAFNVAAVQLRETLFMIHGFEIQVGPVGGSLGVRALREPMPEAPEGAHPGNLDRLFVVASEFTQGGPLARGTEIRMEGSSYELESVELDAYGGARIGVRAR